MKLEAFKATSILLTAILVTAAACISFGNAALAQNCSFRQSTAINPGTGAVTLPWRTDFPTISFDKLLPRQDPAQDWNGYLQFVVGKIKEAGVAISAKNLVMSSSAKWWIMPWLDYGQAGREPLVGLTKERAPLQDDLYSGAAPGAQLWAVGWYNEPGAAVLGSIFANKCDPSWISFSFPDGTASFKMLFTDADPAQVQYLQGSPEIEAYIAA